MRLPGRDVGIVLSDGRLARPGEPIPVSDLRGARLVAPGPGTLFLELRGYGAPRSAWTSVEFDEGERPLATLRPLITELFALTAELDAHVDLSVMGRQDRLLRVQRARLPRLESHAGIIRADVNCGDAWAVARALFAPQREHELVPLGSEPRTWRLLDMLRGPCLVYLRDGEEVVSRPTVVEAPEPDSVNLASLSAVVCTHDVERRRACISAALQRLGDVEHDDALRDLAWLRETAAGLHGLPATALDVLVLLPDSPEALARMVVSAADETERLAIWRLERELPFLWLALPVAAWQAAFAAQYGALQRLLPASFSEADRARLALHQTMRVGGSLVRLEPGMSAVLAACKAPFGEDRHAISKLEDIAATHIRRCAERDHPPSQDAERLLERLGQVGLQPPAELLRFHWPDYEALFVPCVLAASAAGRIRLAPEEQWQARRALHADPDYVSAAYAVVLPRYVEARP